MPTEELRAIEILMNSLTSKGPKTVEVLPNESDSFTNSKLYLFNRITINTLLKYYDNNPLFPQESFLENGIIPGLYETTIDTPRVDLEYKNNPDLFYDRLIASLRNNEFEFDKEGNIRITNPKLDTEINPIWLHRLAETMRTYKYHNVFVYNKNKDAKIYDEESLITYLNQAKTFQVTLTNLPNVDMPDTYNKLRKKTTNTASQKDQVKVDDIIDTFIRYTPEELSPSITKFTIPSPVYIVKKANELGPVFYNAPLTVQQNYISEWLNEYMLSNDIASASLQKTLLIKNQKDVSKLPHKEKQQSICGLTAMLFTLLNYGDLEYDTVSLSDFQIDTYLSQSHQDTQIALNEIIAIVDGTENSPQLAAMKKKIATLMDEINELDASRDKDELAHKQTIINGLFAKYKKIELDKEQLIEKRNSLQNVLYYHKTHDIDDIRFDNPKIGYLLHQASINGQITINPLDNKKVSIKIINPETGRVTFEANIPISKLTKFVEDINFQYEEPEIIMAA